MSAAVSEFRRGREVHRWDHQATAVAQLGVAGVELGPVGTLDQFDHELGCAGVEVKLDVLPSVPPVSADAEGLRAALLARSDSLFWSS